MNGLAVDRATADGALCGASGVPISVPVVTIGQCMGTQWAESAHSDLAFLRSYKQGSTVSFLSGAARIHAGDKRWDDGLPPWDGVSIRVTGNGVDRTVTTGADGRYALTGLEPGAYELRVSVARYIPSTQE